jgi:hypothetical protein
MYRNYQVVIGIWRQDKGFKSHLARLFNFVHKFLKIIVNPSNPDSERVEGVSRNSCSCLSDL